MVVPFDVNVTHSFTECGNLLQNDVTSVPDDYAQDIPERKQKMEWMNVLIEGMGEIYNIYIWEVVSNDFMVSW